MIFQPLDYETQIKIMKITTAIFYLLGSIAFVLIPIIETLLVCLIFLVLFIITDNRLRSHREHKSIAERLHSTQKALKKYMKRGY